MTVDEKDMIRVIRGLDDCDNIKPDVILSSWEKDFVKSLKEYYELSEKQHNCLEKIYNKY